MRFFSSFLLLFHFCQGWAGYYTYPQTDITYAGMTIQCDKGCGVYGDPDLKKIWSILEMVANDNAFRQVWALDATGDGVLLGPPVRCNDEGDYERWDWQAANGIADQDLVYDQEIHMSSYSDFLAVANYLREDVFFYHFTAPKKIREFETNLVAKLEEAKKQGNNIYRVLPGGRIECEYCEGNCFSLRNWKSIDSELSYLSQYGFRHDKSTSQNKKYKKAEDLIERAIREMDGIYRDIFVYCLSRHQPEGIAFTTAIEALLAENLTEGIEHIRSLVEIGESEQFHPDLIGKMHLLKGQLEIDTHLYADAILSLTEAIVQNPALKEAYLERATAYFELGKYDESMGDYLVYADHIQGEADLSTGSFSWAFAKNLPLGAYESGKGFLLFLSDLVEHPILTARQVCKSLKLLSKLAITKEWEALSEALVPEIHQLVVEWDSLSSEKQGELAGYAFGKYGADLLIPGVLAKATAKGLKGGAEVSAAYKSLRAADQTLLLESMAEVGNTTKFAEAIEAAQKTAFLGEEIGLSSIKIGQLKQTGKLETTLTQEYEHLSSAMQESCDLHKKARGMLKPYIKQFLPESEVRELIHKTGIPTFPRPNGIPENYLVKISEKGAGMEYVHPTNTHLRIRVMPGKPHSPFPHQQKPYVIQMKEGKAFDQRGNLVPHESSEAHLPANEFIYRE